MIWTLHIPGWHPAPLNKLLGSHWGKAHGLKVNDKQTVGFACKVYGVPPATGLRRVFLTIILGKGQRGCDTDAYWKSLLDALVACGALKNDSREWVTTAPVEYLRGPAAATLITLEDT